MWKGVPGRERHNAASRNKLSVPGNPPWRRFMVPVCRGRALYFAPSLLPLSTHKLK